MRYTTTDGPNNALNAIREGSLEDKWNLLILQQNQQVISK